MSTEETVARRRWTRWIGPLAPWLIALAVVGIVATRPGPLAEEQPPDKLEPIHMEGKVRQALLALRDVKPGARENAVVFLGNAQMRRTMSRQQVLWQPTDGPMEGLSMVSLTAPQAAPTHYEPFLDAILSLSPRAIVMQVELLVPTQPVPRRDDDPRFTASQGEQARWEETRILWAAQTSPVAGPDLEAGLALLDELLDRDVPVIVLELPLSVTAMKSGPPEYLRKRRDLLESPLGRRDVPYLHPANRPWTNDWFEDGFNLTDDGRQRFLDALRPQLEAVLPALPDPDAELPDPDAPNWGRRAKNR